MKSKVWLSACLAGFLGGLIVVAALRPQDGGGSGNGQGGNQHENPPPGAVGEFTGGGEGEDPGPEDAWMDQQVADRLADTEFYLCGYEPSNEKPFGGEQFFGTMDKLGVDHQVFDALSSNQQSLLSQIGSDNSAREAHVTMGVSAGETWNVVICNLNAVNGEQRLVVRADCGKDVDSPTGLETKSSIVLGEVWRITETSVTLLERDETQMVLVGLGKTTAEMNQ